MKLLCGFVVFVDNTAIGAGKLDRMGNDGGEHGFKIESRADRLADLAQRFQLAYRSRQLAGSRFQFLEQPDVLDGDDRLIGEGLEEGDLLIARRGGPPCRRIE